jgi:FAD/FMN-containing dehydrogenase
VVIPLPRMGDYCDGIERINIELSIANKLALCDALKEFLRGRTAAACGRRQPRCRGAARRPRQALQQAVAGHLDRCRGRAQPGRGWLATSTGVNMFHRLQDYRLRVSWKTELKAPLEVIFDGNAFGPVLAEHRAIHKEMLRGRVFVALHMHAGDGNVHTNIPVNSDNYAMLQDRQPGRRAHHGAGEIAGRRDLRRARHRHHQAGIPDDEEIRPLPRLQAARRSRKAASTAAS